jgi:hypothetical protein
MRRPAATEPEMTPARYGELITSIRATVMEVVRPGARILVVSRGDDELLRFENRVAWHFPRLDNGSYAGYHPASSEAAIEHLEALRGRGARHFLLPSPLFWWRDYYSGLFDHLAENTTAAWEGEACAIYELEPVSRREADVSPLARPIGRLLEALLPAGAKVAVSSSGDPSLLTVAGAVHLPHTEGGGYAGDLGSDEALEQLAVLGRNGPAFLVLPHVVPAWVDGYPEFLEAVEERYRCIARRERVCNVYELGGHPKS